MLVPLVEDAAPVPVFLVVPAPVMPFLIVLMTVRFPVAAPCLGAAALVVAPFLTTVEVLPSLDSLAPLAARVSRSAPLLPAAGTAAGPPFLVLGAVAPAVLDCCASAAACPACRASAVARVERAFSTMWLSMAEAPTGLDADVGRAIMDLPGARPPRSRV